MLTLYTAVVAITILLLFTTAMDVWTNRLITKEKKRWGVTACVVIGLSSMGECLGVLTNGAAPSLIVLHQMAKLMEYSVAPMIGATVAVAYGTVKYPRWMLSVAAGHAVFECVAVWFGWVFWVDGENLYHRGPLYGIYVVIFALSILVCVVGIIRSGKQHQTGIDSVLVLSVLITVVGIVIQFMNSAARIDFLCISISNYLLYSRFCKIVLQLDAVTGLLNRRCYDTVLGTLDDRAAVVFFDINRFKAINDTYGHAVGDVCLRKVGTLLRQVYGHDGTCYRIGGDEFCVILESRLEQLEEMNAQFSLAVQAAQKTDSRMPDVALGYAWYDAGESHIQKVIEEADAMMYRNKAQLSGES